MHCRICRGETFRTELIRLGEVRSLLPDGVNVMALTATATNSLRYSISHTIGMLNPFVIAVAPCKQNLMYSVRVFESLVDTFMLVLDTLKTERATMPRIIILYGHSFALCADIFLFFKAGLGENITEPSDAPDLSRFRLVDVFTSVTDQLSEGSDFNCCIWHGH